MKKLTLHLDDLRIDSFRTSSPETTKGTVVGEEATCGDFQTCCYSCAATCRGSCPPGTCYQTCPAYDSCYMAAC
ncbi:hypothetical protein [Longimicrobium sp.]|uniref:hypothetical protein n=1 Tax=Longimicrobium sp. TaxID=2029185 RepID=UPI002E37A527|nr:hypothetical protein [Longimicrobium sp.]HEX6041612.1 hypothetical protein [Longimicrobium sp.]